MLLSDQIRHCCENRSFPIHFNRGCLFRLQQCQPQGVLIEKRQRPCGRKLKLSQLLEKRNLDQAKQS